MQAEETWRKIGLVAFHKVTGRPWRISRHCSWFTHTPACSPIPHKRFSSVSHFPRFASCIPCFGSCPRSVHDRPLQRLKHSGHFVPSKYTVCNLIFHKVGSLQEADRQSPVNRRLTDISVQENLVYRCQRILFFQKF